MPPVVDIYKRLHPKRGSRDVSPFRQEDRKKSTSLTSLFSEEGYVRQKSSSVMQVKGWCDDFLIKNQEYRHSEHHTKHENSLPIFFDYDRILQDEKKEFEFRLDNTPGRSGKLDDYLILKKLGSGQFGKVYLVQDFMDKKYHAMKAISKELIVKNKLKEDVEQEKDYLYATNSPFIISLIHHFEDGQRVYFVQEYMSGGDIYEQLKLNGPFSEELTRFYSGQVVLALEYLHNVNLIYRDLKPENVMLDAHGYIKLIDFGFVKRVTTKTNTMVGTPAYMAPEMILHKAYEKSIDWWAFGILVYEMMAGIQITPFRDSNLMTMYEKIAACKDISFPSKFPNSVVRDLIKRLLKVNTSVRLGNGPNGSKDVKNHPWFASMKWMDLYRRNIMPPTKATKSGSVSPKYERNVQGVKQSALGVTPGKQAELQAQNRRKLGRLLKF